MPKLAQVRRGNLNGVQIEQNLYKLCFHLNQRAAVHIKVVAARAVLKSPYPKGKPTVLYSKVLKSLSLWPTVLRPLGKAGHLLWAYVEAAVATASGSLANAWFMVYVIFGSETGQNHGSGGTERAVGTEGDEVETDKKATGQKRGAAAATSGEGAQAK